MASTVGIEKVGTNRYNIRVRATCPRTGRRKEVERVRGKLVEATDEALAFAEWLSPEEVSAIVRRIDVILSAGTFPKPGPHRSYPWPLV